MKNAVLAVLLASPALAVDFDGGVDASAALAGARAAAASYNGDYGYSGNSWDYGCSIVRFEPGQHDRTRTTAIVSVERSCSNVASNHSGPCPETGKYRQLGAAVTVRNAQPLLPWESDSFRVCGQGSWLDISEAGTAYRYKVVQLGTSENGGEFIVEPVKKIATPADADGLEARFDGSLFYSDVQMPDLRFADKWAKEYAGEKIEIRFELKKRVKGLPDGVVASGTLRSDVKAEYVVSGFRLDEHIRSTGLYYVEYSFRRLGSVSKADWTPKRKSDEVQFVEGGI